MRNLPRPRASNSCLVDERGGDTRSVFGFDSFQGFPHATSCDMIDGTVPSSSNSKYFAGSEDIVTGEFGCCDDDLSNVPGVTHPFNHSLDHGPTQDGQHSLTG